MAKANGTRSRSGAVSKGPGSREGLSTALHRADLVGTRIELDTQDDGPEHRAFPRAKLMVPFGLWIGEGDGKRFSATLTSVNVSVSGAFLRSSFFLPVGTELSVRFQVEPTGRVVDALAAWELLKVTSPNDPWRTK